MLGLLYFKSAGPALSPLFALLATTLSTECLPFGQRGPVLGNRHAWSQTNRRTIQSSFLVSAAGRLRELP